MVYIKARLHGQKLAKKRNRDFSINIQHLILLRLNVLLESNIMAILTYKDSDNIARVIQGCNHSVDKHGKHWIWSEQLEHNLVYKSATYENALLASIASLLHTIELKDERLKKLQSIADLASAFADKIKPDEQETYY